MQIETMKQTSHRPTRGMDGFRLASEIGDAAIFNKRGDEIASIDDLVIDSDNGRIRFAVVGVGGFLGMGETKVIVPWNAFQRHIHQDDGDMHMHYTLDVSREQLEKAPRFDRDRLNEFYSREMSEPVFRHYHVTYVA